MDTELAPKAQTYAGTGTVRYTLPIEPPKRYLDDIVIAAQRSRIHGELAGNDDRRPPGNVLFDPVRNEISGVRRNRIRARDRRPGKTDREGDTDEPCGQ